MPTPCRPRSTRCRQGFRDIDVLVNNAGLALGTAPAQRADLTQWRTMIDTNITALATLTHALLPTLIARKGMIINISSIAAHLSVQRRQRLRRHQGLRHAVLAGPARRPARHRRARDLDRAGPGAKPSSRWCAPRATRRRPKRCTQDAHPITGEDIAETLWWVANLPPHLNVNRLEVMPVSQSFAGFQIHRGD